MLHPSASLCPGFSPSHPSSAAGTRAVSWPLSQTDNNGMESMLQTEVTEGGKLENLSFLSKGNQSQPALRSAGLSQTSPRSMGLWFSVTPCLMMSWKHLSTSAPRRQHHITHTSLPVTGLCMTPCKWLKKKHSGR